MVQLLLGGYGFPPSLRYARLGFYIYKRIDRCLLALDKNAVYQNQQSPMRCLYKPTIRLLVILYRYF